MALWGRCYLFTVYKVLVSAWDVGDSSGRFADKTFGQFRPSEVRYLVTSSLLGTTSSSGTRDTNQKYNESNGNVST